MKLWLGVAATALFCVAMAYAWPAGSPRSECSGACGEHYECDGGCYCLIVEGKGSCVSY